MVTALLVMVVGLVLLAWGASRFVDGSASAARHLGVPPLLIGMVVIGFGTSAPEMAIAGLSSGEGTPSLAVGNALGANIANLALILGLSAAITPITLNSRALRGETMVLACVTALAFWLCADREVSRLDATLLLGALTAALVRNVRQGLRLRSDVLGKEAAESLKGTSMPLARSLLWLAIGVTAVLLGSQLIIWGATELARALGLSELIIGLTIVSLGTTMPELAASVSAARKGEDDLALGNLIGSNLFNTTAVIGLAAWVQPLPVAADVLRRDLPVAVALTLALVLLSFRAEGRIGRPLGLGLILAYGAYVLTLLRSIA